MCYDDAGNSDYGTCSLVTRNPSSNALSPGSEVIFSSVTTYYTATAAPSGLVGIVCYADNTNSEGKCSRLSAPALGALTPTSTITFNSAGVANLNTITSLTSSTAVNCYDDSGSSGACNVLTLASGGLSAGAKYTFSTSRMYAPQREPATP